MTAERYKLLKEWIETDIYVRWFFGIMILLVFLYGAVVGSFITYQIMNK